MIQTMVCPYCLNDVEFKVGEGAVRQYSCPQCNEAVPLRYVHDYKQYPPAIMAVIGLKGHGKTCYLASLFNELERTAEREWSEFSISPLDEEGLKVLREKQESLLGNRLPESTPKVFPKPVVLRLSKVPGYGNWHLLCYDISGEVFLKALEVREYGGYLSRVDEVIWLLDIKGGDRRLGERGRISANALIEFMVRYDQAVMELGGDLKRQRLILVLTKGDQLVDELGSRLKDYLEREGWDREEAEAVSTEVRSWLSSNGYNNFVKEIENRFLEVRYTILSALGSLPRGKTREIEVRPRRVKNPLLMILDLNRNKIKEKKKRFYAKLYIKKTLIYSIFILAFSVLIHMRHDLYYFSWRTQKLLFPERYYLEKYQTLGTHKSFVNCIGFSPDGNSLISGGDDKKVFIWRRDSVAPHMSYHEELKMEQGVKKIKISPKGDLVIVGLRKGIISAIDINKTNIVWSKKEHRDDITFIEFTPDGKHLFTGSYDGSEIIIWEVPSGRIIRRLPIKNLDSLTNGIILEKEEMIYLAGQSRLTWLDISLDKPLNIKQIKILNGGNCLIYSPKTGNLVYSQDNKLYFLSIKKQKNPILLGRNDELISEIILLKEQYIIASAGFDGKISLWNLINKKIIAEKFYENGLTALALSPRGDLLVAGDTNGDLQLLKIVKRK